MGGRQRFTDSAGDAGCRSTERPQAAGARAGAQSLTAAQSSPYSICAALARPRAPVSLGPEQGHGRARSGWRAQGSGASALARERVAPRPASRLAADPAAPHRADGRARVEPAGRAVFRAHPASDRGRSARGVPRRALHRSREPPAPRGRGAGPRGAGVRAPLAHGAGRTRAQPGHAASGSRARRSAPRAGPAHAHRGEERPALRALEPQPPLARRPVARRVLHGAVVRRLGRARGLTPALRPPPPERVDRPARTWLLSVGYRRGRRARRR